MGGQTSSEWLVKVGRNTQQLLKRLKTIREELKGNEIDKPNK